jgi:hypothetical protein
VIELQGVSVNYGAGPSLVRAACDVSFEGRVSQPYSQQLLRANQGFDASGVLIDDGL